MDEMKNTPYLRSIMRLGMLGRDERMRAGTGRGRRPVVVKRVLHIRRSEASIPPIVSLGCRVHPTNVEEEKKEGTAHSRTDIRSVRRDHRLPIPAASVQSFDGSAAQSKRENKRREKKKGGGGKEGD